MKKIQAVALAAGAFAVVSLGTPNAAEAAAQQAPRPFQEFEVPLQALYDPVYQHAQIVDFATYAVYNSPFGIIPIDLYLIAARAQASLEAAFWMSR